MICLQGNSTHGTLKTVRKEYSVASGIYFRKVFMHCKRPSPGPSGFLVTKAFSGSKDIAMKTSANKSSITLERNE